MARRRTPRSALPGFGLSLGTALLYLSLVVLLPLSTIVLRSFTSDASALLETIFSKRALSAYALTFGAAFLAAAIDAVFGLLAAWVLVRYRFPGRKLLDAMIDLPFALPTAVAGISLTSLYAETGWFGAPLADLGIKVAFTRIGVVLALAFVSLPFVIRTVQPVLEELEKEMEECAAVLGASRLTAFVRVVLPNLIPALLTGFALAFARAIGEYGSVVFISGNMPMRTEIAPLLIMTRLEQFDYAGATAIALVLLFTSFALLFVINRLQAWSRVRTGHAR